MAAVGKKLRKPITALMAHGIRGNNERGRPARVGYAVKAAATARKENDAVAAPGCGCERACQGTKRLWQSARDRNLLQFALRGKPDVLAVRQTRTAERRLPFPESARP